MANIPWIDPCRLPPAWLDWGVPLNQLANKRQSIRYYRHIYLSKPRWVDRKDIAAIYKEAGRLREMGHDVEVDHVVPLRNPLVCGLHCPANLEIRTRRYNQDKGNHWWPGMPGEQLELLQEEQLTLEL